MVYFRSAYAPTDFPSDQEWQARQVIESSTAIKCPSLAYHLLGTKKIQQVMALPGVIEKFVSTEQAQLIRSVFTGLYSLDQSQQQIIDNAIQHEHDYVLKPQREGGGNLIYGDAMKHALQNLTQEDRDKYVLMKRITPKPYTTYLLREGIVTMGDCICELGIFGLYLGDGKQELLNENGGYLLRTKLENVEDGGVAAGVAFLDSIYLKD